MNHGFGYGSIMVNYGKTIVVINLRKEIKNVKKRASYPKNKKKRL